MKVYAPRVARAAQPGQFVIVRVGENGERIPLTICDYDREAGTITLVVQIIGASSRKICALKDGDSFTDFVGPLGHPSEFIYESEEKLRSTSRLFVAGSSFGNDNCIRLSYAASEEVLSEAIRRIKEALTE